MSIRIKKIYSLIVWGLLLCALVMLSKSGMYGLDNFYLQENGGDKRPVTLPVSETSPGHHIRYELEGDLRVGWLSPRRFVFIADDRLMALSVNDHPVDLSQYDPNSLGDYRKGTSIDLEDYLNTGENSVVVEYVDTGGRMGLAIKADSTDHRFILLTLVWSAFAIALFVYVLRKLGFGPVFILIIASGLLVRLLYLSVTDYDTRAHDTFDHLSYINYFVENKSLPPIEMSAIRVFFHPPLYYASTALIPSAVDFLVGGQKNLVNLSIQIISLIYSIIFVVFSVKTILLFFAKISFLPSSEAAMSRSGFSDTLRKPAARYATLASLLLVFWPSAVLHSTRVGNDPLVYMFSAIALYFLVKFYFTPRPRYAVLFSFAVALGVLTKVSAGIFIPVAFVVLLIMLIRRQLILDLKLAKMISVCVLIIGFATAFALYPGVALKLQGGKDNIYIEDIDNLHSGLRVNNEASSYFWFDVKIFMTQAYTSPWNDHQGRQFFWNYLSKTSLFGEWTFEGPIAAILASLISLTFLVILFYTLIAALNMKWLDIIYALPILTYFVAMYLAVTYMRVTFPVNIDFRYILPTLTCSALFVNYFLFRLQHRRPNRFVIWGEIAQIIFVIASILFIFSVFIQGLMS